MRSTFVACSLLLGLADLWAMADEVHIRREALPVAVGAAIESRYRGATIVALTRETTMGVALFEVTLRMSGRQLDAVFDAQGMLRAEETGMSFGQLPANVRETHAHSAQGKWTIERVELVTSAAPYPRAHYELLAFDGKKRLELAYGMDGRRMSLRRVDRKD
jgi:hypothetical protein